MEIHLFHSEAFATPRLPSGDTLLKIQLKTEKQSKTVQANASHEEYRQKLLAVSTQYGQMNNGHSVGILVKKNPANPKDFSKCIVRMEGFLQDNLDSLWVEGLKARIQLSCIPYANSGKVGYQQYPVVLCANIPIEKPTSPSAANAVTESGKAEGVKGGLFSEVKDFPTHTNIWKYAFKDFNSGKSTHVLGFVTVSLISNGNHLVNSANDQLALVNIEEQGLARICKSILDSKLHLDVAMIAKDGTVFDCNKAFLAAQSDVLAAMLETDMKEAKTNQIEMNDMTAIGVKALLEYVYTLDLDQVFENCDVALELLQAGHKYNIKSLEKQVSSIVLKKKVEWFTVDMAFSLFLFTRKVDTMKELKLKAVSLLMSKSKEFMECKTYKNLFQENSAQSSEAVQELFCLSQAK